MFAGLSDYCIQERDSAMREGIALHIGRHVGAAECRPRPSQGTANFPVASFVAEFKVEARGRIPVRLCLLVYRR